MESAKVIEFQKTVWEYFARSGRHDLPWRQPEADGSFDPYKILVSELMLQQTQVPRVMPKYDEFLRQFPTVQSLAAASLGAVLTAWQGLGYNRRAKFLWQAAQKIVQDFAGEFPRTPQLLESLPGVGKNTATAIMAYAFNEPVVFVETNIRTVYIHHFFRDQTNISDRAILDLITRTLPQKGKEQPDKMYSILPARREKPLGLSRMWYWALMDYGTFLKQTIGNLNKHSKTYAKQSKFVGSNRQIRGQVIRLLAKRPHALSELAAAIPDERLPAVLDSLESEQMVRQRAGRYGIS